MDMGIKALRLVHVPQQLSLIAFTDFPVLFLFLFGKSSSFTTAFALGKRAHCGRQQTSSINCIR